MKDRTAIRVRMYRVGFGDCFLVTLPTTSGIKHMLVDCGVHKRGDIRVLEAKREVSLIEKAVADIAAETGRKLAIVVATHQHQDHISGFVDEWFHGFDVREVWMPWMDNRADPKAQRLKARQAALVRQLTAHFAASPGAPEAMAAVENLASNPGAVRLLESAFGTGTAKYLKAGDELKDAAGVDGLAVKVLAPSTDAKFLTRMDPPAGQRFMRATPSGVKADNVVEPFESKWVDDDKRSDELALTDAFRQSLKDSAESADGLALALDRVRNNTSLVVSLNFRGRRLLFPGDAQYGNWISWLDGPGADDILANVEFYKASHHGSFNATPKAALEKMRAGSFAAMVSTQNVPWPAIPLPKLMRALEKQTSNRVARSDSIQVKALKPPPRAPSGTLARCFRQGPFWIDYFMPV